MYGRMIVNSFKTMLKSALVAAALTLSYGAEADSWIWYPGQLGAHMQTYQRTVSKERCVNVDYPGKFNPPVTESYFKVKASALRGVTTLPSTSGDITGYRVGRDMVFKVVTDGGVPSVMVPSVDGWSSSLDGKNWNLIESDPMYCSPEKYPGAMMEEVVPVGVAAFTPIVNASIVRETITMKKGGKALVDFGEDEMGSVSFIADGKGTLHFSVGESPEEAMNQDLKWFEQYALDPVKVDGIGEFTLPVRALRYLYIRSEGEVSMTALTFNTLMWPVERKMTFESSDPSLNRLFEIGVKTLHTSMHNFYLDGIKRDYLPWSMDAIVSVLGGNFAFGDRQVSRNGINVALMPPSPSRSDWGIVDYPLYALIGIKEDYLHWGDLSTVNMYWDRITQQLALYEKEMNPDGLIFSNRISEGLNDASGDSGFVPGWGKDMGPEQFGTPAYPQMLLYMNFRIGEYLASVKGLKNLAAHYGEVAGKVAEGVKKNFWSEKDRAFLNGYYVDGTLDRRISHHAQYMAVIAGLYPEEHYDYLFGTLIPSIPHYYDNISYEKGFEFLSYLKAGKLTQYKKMMEDIWGGWLDEGYCRFPENFSPLGTVEKKLEFYGRAYGLSLCHGANGVGPILFALRGVFGFSQDENNLSSYTVSPDLFGMESASGRIPVKEGYIELDLHSKGESLISIPDGCTVSVPGKTLSKGGVYSFNLQ